MYLLVDCSQSPSVWNSFSVFYFDMKQFIFDLCGLATFEEYPLVGGCLVFFVIRFRLCIFGRRSTEVMALYLIK